MFRKGDIDESSSGTWKNVVSNSIHRHLLKLNLELRAMPFFSSSQAHSLIGGEGPQCPFEYIIS